MMPMCKTFLGKVSESAFSFQYCTHSFLAQVLPGLFLGVSSTFLEFCKNMPELLFVVSLDALSFAWLFGEGTENCK